MIYSYFPGCTLKDRAKEADACARLSAKEMGIELLELESWQCCGGVYPQTRDEIGSRLPAVRALSAARETGTLVTVCTACHNVLKRTNADWNRDADFRRSAENYLKGEYPYDGGTRVIHLLELIREEIGFAELKKRVKNPLTGQKIGAFYGCMALRPGKDMLFDDPENPRVMEELLAALGAEPVLYPYRNECCGAYLSVEDKEAAEKIARRAADSAKNAGCEMLVTACPLCQYNMKDKGLPVKYFTELMAEALLDG